MTYSSGRGAGAVLHSHSKDVVLASMAFPGSEFRVSDVEMLRGVFNPCEGRPYRADETLIVPIVENAASEAELARRVLEVMKAYPQSNAVIVRRHGMFVWGDSWQQVDL